MDKTKRDRILNSTWTFIGSVLLVGPFALPLLWRNPRFSQTTKILWSVLVLGLTVFLLWGTAKIGESMLDILQP